MKHLYLYRSIPLLFPFYGPSNFHTFQINKNHSHASSLFHRHHVFKRRRTVSGIC